MNRTPDLWIMSPTSYLCSIPQYLYRKKDLNQFTTYFDSEESFSVIILFLQLWSDMGVEPNLYNRIQTQINMSNKKITRLPVSPFLYLYREKDLNLQGLLPFQKELFRPLLSLITRLVGFGPTPSPSEGDMLPVTLKSFVSVDK